MIKYIKGDLLTTDADMLLHQVNLQGVMGGGLALQIAKKYPNVEKEYIEYEPKMLGNVCFARTDTFTIANCFSQDRNFNTNYSALEQCLDRVKRTMEVWEFKKLAIPYKYGCGIANGDWDRVLSIFEKIFKDYELLIYQL